MAHAAQPGDSASGAARAVFRHRFGVFAADLRARELRKHGIRLKLQELPFAVLAALLENPGEVVTREELQHRLWPDGTFVDFDHGISSAVNKLRSALGDSSSNPRYVERVGRGYRFIYPVSLELPPPAPLAAQPQVAPPYSRRAFIAAGGALALLILAGASILIFRRLSTPPASGIHSLAVLPLKNLSGDQAQQYFSEGLTDELTTRLASLHGLRVISHTSAMHYADTREPLPAIAKELNVDAVVEGTVLRANGKIRITAQLIQAPADRHLWAQSYERDERDIVQLQDDVARDIAANIRLNLNPTERQRLSLPHSCGNLQAGDLYQRGQFLWNKRTVPDMEQANNYFQQAIAKDPNCAAAHAAVADTYVLIDEYSGIYDPRTVEKARAAALHGLELDPDSAEAHTALALIVENYDWDWRRSESEFQRALELDPNYATAHHWYAEHLAWRGRFDEALRESEVARQLDPLSLIIATDNGVILYYSRQYDRAIAKFKSVIAQDPQFPRAELITNAYLFGGNPQAALAAIQTRNLRISDAAGWTSLAYIYGYTGQRAQANYAFTRFLKLRRTQHVDAASEAIANIGIRKYDRALAIMEKAATQQPNALVALKVEPLYDPLALRPSLPEPAPPRGPGAVTLRIEELPSAAPRVTREGGNQCMARRGTASAVPCEPFFYIVIPSKREGATRTERESRGKAFAFQIKVQRE